MKVQGSDCSIVIKTVHREFDVPYSEETIREAVSLLQEEASIEGNGICKAIQKKCGVTGCVVTPLTIGTAPLLLYLAFGSVGLPVFVSETKSLYNFQIDLLPLENSDFFDLIQDRNGERKYFEDCRVISFELRFEREQAVKLKIDVAGDRSAVVYPYAELPPREIAERFFGDNVSYKINGKEYKNIYGLTMFSKKESGTKTELWIRQSLEYGGDIPDVIEELTVEAELLKDKYEFRYFGSFRITFEKLVLMSDEINIDTASAVIGPLRFYVSGNVSADVFSSSEGL